MSALRPLLSGIVDYAGLFPPAALDMQTAARNYAEYRHDPEGWMLGRFVLPVARLDEFATALAESFDGGDEWQLSAIAGSAIDDDVARITEFNEAHLGRALVDTIEMRLESIDKIERAARVAEAFDLFAEVPIDPDPAPLVAAIAVAGIGAKVRTGGLTPDAFPRARDIVRFMRRCVASHVRFKATAGLHHPLRGDFRLTYASDAPRGTMYGYLNVFLTAALLEQLSDDEAVALLEERDRSAIAVTRDFIRWRDHEARNDELRAMRERIAASFGSCSFREPTDELQELSLER